MRISDWSSDVCSSDLAGARALQRRAELPADSLEEFCAERLVELATDRRADLVIDLGARRQSRTTLRSSSDSARRGHDDLIVGRDRDLRDLLVSTAAKATEPALEQEAAGARADALDRRREAAVGALRAGILDCVRSEEH